MQLAEISTEQILKHCQGNFLAYCLAVQPAYRPGALHRFLCQRLQQAAQTKRNRLIITVPPQFGKSALASELLPSYLLGLDPVTKIFAASYGQSLCNGFGRKVRNYLKNPVYRAIFPETRLADDSQSVSAFATTSGGVYNAMGVGGSGSGKAADWLLIDDLIKNRKEADSPVYRENLIDWYLSVARTRLHTDSSILVVNTRWGTADYISWLLSETSHEGWELINLPALALDNDLLGRQPGESLWPERHSVEDLLVKQQTLGRRDWSAIYQQCPVAEEDCIFAQCPRLFYDQPPQELIHTVTSWDLSFGGKGEGSSWVVGSVWGLTRDSFGRLDKWLLWQQREQIGFSSTLNAVRELAKRFPTGPILIENKANGPAVIETLLREIPRITPVEPQGGKEDRAYAVVPLFERGEVHLPNPNLYPWVKPLLNEIDLFPQAGTDDCVDSMTQALITLKGHGGEVRVGINTEKTRRQSAMRDWRG